MLKPLHNLNHYKHSLRIQEYIYKVNVVMCPALNALHAVGFLVYNIIKISVLKQLA